MREISAVQDDVPHACASKQASMEPISSVQIAVCSNPDEPDLSSILVSTLRSTFGSSPKRTTRKGRKGKEVYIWTEETRSHYSTHAQYVFSLPLFEYLYSCLPIRVEIREERRNSIDDTAEIQNSVLASFRKTL